MHSLRSNGHVTVTIAGYKYATESRKHDPKEWSVAARGWRSRCVLSFEVVLPGIMSTLTEVFYDDIASKERVAQFPQNGLSKVRRHKAKQKAVC